MFHNNPGYEFDELVEFLFEENYTYRLWGAAEIGKGFVERFSKKLNIVQIVDKSIQKQGTILGNISVEEPEKLEYDDNSIVIATCSYYLEN